MKQSRIKKVILYLVLLSFLLIKITHLLIQKGISWDSAVYIEMGKYIFSLGKVGLWEPARPLVWPIFLGFLWKIGLNPIIFGGILELIFGIGCVYTTYLIGKESFNENVALLASFFLAFSPTFLFYSSALLTEISSTLFSLLTVYFFIRNRYFLTGLFLSLSFMTRFLQLFILIPIILVLFLYKKKGLKKMISLSYGFLAILVPYLILNILLYKNVLHPFWLQVFMTKYTGWVFHQPLTFYFINLLKENFLIVFVIIGILIAPKQKNSKKITILGIFLLFFIFFNFIVHKEIRFIIVFLPYMYLVVCHGIFKIFNLVKKKKRWVYLVISIIGIFWLSSEVNQIKIPSFKEYPKFTDYMSMDNVENGIWISNPIFIVNSNKKADELIYYPLYNSKKIETLKEKLPQANHILMDTCDILPCPPEDNECPAKTTEFLSYLKENFRTIYYKKENGCEEFIFVSAS